MDREDEEFVRAAVAEYLTGKHCVLWGQAWEISSQSGVNQAVEWMTKEVMEVLDIMDRMDNDREECSE